MHERLTPQLMLRSRKKILSEGEYCPPLSTDALKKHDLETSCELRQFCCPECYVYWWKTVPKYKPVSTCFHCRLCLNPLEHQEQFGVGRFTCQCGNYFYSKCQGSDVRACIKCGRTLHRPYIHPLFRKDDFQRIPITAKQGHPTGKAPHVGHYYLPGGYVPHTRTRDNFASNDAPVYLNLPQPRRRPHRSQFSDFIPATFYHESLHQPATSNPTAHISTMQTLVYPAYYGSVEGINPSIAAHNAYPPKQVVPVDDSCGPSFHPNIPPLSQGNKGELESVGSTQHVTTSSRSAHVDLQYSQASSLYLSNSQESLDPSLPTLSVDSPLQGHVNDSTSTGDQPPASLSKSSLPTVKSIPLHTAISALAIEVSSGTTSSASATQLASSSNSIPLVSPINANFNTARNEGSSENPSPIMSTTSLSSATEPLSVAKTPLVHAPENTSYDLSIPSNSTTVDPLAISNPSLSQSPLENGVPSVDKPMDFTEISAISRFYSPTSETTAESSITSSPHTNPLLITANDSTQLNLLSTDLSLLQAEVSAPSSLLVTTDNSTDLSAFQTKMNTSVDLKPSQEFA